MTRYVFVTGGVVSSLGKGIAAASLAAVLEALKVVDRTVALEDPFAVETRPLKLTVDVGGEDE